MADQIIPAVDYDYGQFHISTNLIVNVATRAKKLDEVASGFLARHPDAVGLDLGAGLDTRMVPRPAVHRRLVRHRLPGGSYRSNVGTPS
jgi:O-methyltransferase involved in polyketide biosynthesis